MLGGRFRVLDRIGSGGMAEVFRARDEVLDRLVAIKVFRAEHIAHGDAHGGARQQLEVAALARLNHPNLIALYDGSLDGDNGPAFIVMELIEGPSLAARIAEGPLPEASVREIAIQLADGLAYVHAQGMVHRDVKPENILLGIDKSDDDSTVRARLSDFGIVRLLGSERLTSADLTLGTASYLAPEQARGSHVDPPADIYALGLVLLEALTGRRTYEGPALEAALARLSQRPEIPPGLPEPWPGLLYAMTETDPGLRPSAAEAARVLRNEGSRAMPLVPLAVPVAAGFAEAPTGMVPAAAAAAPAAAAPAAAAPGAAAPPLAPRRRRVSTMAIVAAVSLLVILTTLGIFLFTGNDAKSPAQAPGGRTPAPAAEQTSSSTGSKAPSGRADSSPAAVPVANHHSSSASSSVASSSAPASSHTPTGRPSTSAHAPSTPPRTSPAHSKPASTPATSPSTPNSTPTQPSTSAGSTGATSANASSPAGAGSTTAG